MSRNGHLLFSTYIALCDAISADETPWKSKRRIVAQDVKYSPENLNRTIQQTADPGARRLLEELQAARHIRDAKEKKRQALEAQRESERMQEKEEQRNFKEAQATGQIAECACCMEDMPLNRMVACNADDAHVS